MRSSGIADAFDYNYWANKRILNAAAQTAMEQLAAPAPFPFGSLRGTLVHILEAEYGWRVLLENAHQTESWGAVELSESNFPTLASIEQRWQQEEASMRAYIAHLTDESLEDIVRYTTDEGNRRERVRWHCLYHVVNHGTQHRAEAAAMLTDYGHSPGDLDFTVFLNERK